MLGNLCIAAPLLDQASGYATRAGIFHVQKSRLASWQQKTLVFQKIGPFTEMTTLGYQTTLTFCPVCVSPVTLPTAEILSGKNALAWVLMVLYLKNKKK